MAWLSLGPDIAEVPTAGGVVGTLRERIAEQYSAPFDAIFEAPTPGTVSDASTGRPRSRC